MKCRPGNVRGSLAADPSPTARWGSTARGCGYGSSGSPRSTAMPAAPGTPGRASVGLVRSVPIRLAQTPTTYWVRAEPHRDRPINRTCGRLRRSWQPTDIRASSSRSRNGPRSRFRMPGTLNLRIRFGIIATWHPLTLQSMSFGFSQFLTGPRHHTTRQKTSPT